MSLLLGIIAYFAIGFLLAKGYTLYTKTSYVDMGENTQVLVIVTLFFYPLAIVFFIAVFIGNKIENILKKIL